MTRAFQIAIAAAVAALASVQAYAQELPPATKAMLERTKLPASILNGLDRELALPPDWLEGAKKEGNVRVSGSWDQAQFRKMNAAFEHRYPFIKLAYSRGSRQERVLVPLMAFKSGRYTVDVISGMGVTFPNFRDAGALEDMRDIPNWANVPDGMKDTAGLWVGERLRYWCMSYNTALVPKDQLPKTWDDMLDNPIWRGGQLALSDRPNLWLGNVWVMPGHGDEWGKRYIERLFTDLQPQMRKEGNNALVALVVNGEFRAAVPTADYRAAQYQRRGAPVAWHCPEPVPLATSELGMMKNNPNRNASRIWVNWFLSKEGQIAQFDSDHAPPVHKDLQTVDFQPFPEQVVGRKIAFREPGVVEGIMPKLYETWNALWQAKGVAGVQSK